MKKTLSTSRRQRHYRMRPTKLNVRRMVFLVIIVVVGVHIGYRFNSGGDGPLVERLDEKYDYDESNSEEFQSSFSGGISGEGKSEKETDYEFDESDSELDEISNVLKRDDSEGYYESIDNGDAGSRGEWSVDSGQRARNSLKNNTVPNGVATTISENNVENETNGIHNDNIENKAEVKSDGAGVFLDDAAVINEDGKIIKDTHQDDHAGGADGVSMATDESDGANQLQHDKVSAQHRNVSEEKVETEFSEEDRKDNNSGGMVTDRKGVLDRNSLEQRRNDSDPRPPLAEYYTTEKNNEDNSDYRQPFIKQRGSGEDDIEKEEEGEKEEKEEEEEEEEVGEGERK